jgi:hypothetical protein
VHLQPRVGTNIPVMNGLIHLIIEAGQINLDYINAHTVGFEKLKSVVSQWTPARVQEVANISEYQLRAAADILGSAPTLVSTVLQGVYQSMQATAAACQVNNLHLIRGMIGRQGCGVLQMNGQPTAQNTRETELMVTCPVFAIGATSNTSKKSLDCGMSMWISFLIGRLPLTQCKSFAIANKARSRCCGLAAQIQRCQCLKSLEFVGF